MKSDGFCVLLVRGFVLVRHISGDLKIALVFGVVCIGVEGFFFGLLFLLLLCESIEAAACRQRNQHDYAQKAAIARIKDSGFTDSEKEDMLWRNAAKILKAVGKLPENIEL